MKNEITNPCKSKIFRICMLDPYKAKREYIEYYFMIGSNYFYPICRR